jgi:hypothetical protein
MRITKITKLKEKLLLGLRSEKIIFHLKKIEIIFILQIEQKAPPE